MTTLSVHAIESGGTSNFTCDKTHYDGAGFVVFKVEGYKGSCVQKGVQAASSGKAEMTKRANGNILTKAAYYVDVEKGWFANSTDRPAIFDSSGVGSRFRAGILAEDVMQCANQGASYWSQRALAQTYPQKYVNYVVNIVENVLPDVEVPSNFVLYKGVPNDDSQAFAVWKFVEDGSLEIQKVAEDDTTTSFTFDITVEGASGTISGVKFTKGAAQITLKGGQTKKIEGLPGNAKYTVKEADIPSGWELASSTGASGTIASGTTKTATFTNKKMLGFLKLQKASANPSITG